MARSVNKVFLLGRLGQDPEVKTFSNGGSVTNINLATEEQWKDKNGEQQKRTEWHRVTFRGGAAGIAEKYLRKGDQCHIEGKLQTREWEKDGQKRQMTEIVVHNLVLLGQGGGKSDGSSRSSGPVQPVHHDDDDAPF